MPIYDFMCEKCGKVEERFVHSSKDIDTQYCGCNPSEKTCDCDCDVNDTPCKLIKIESFGSSKPIFKGTGFYETDYKNK